MRSWLAHAFLPRKSNRHRAWLLHPNGLAVVATIIVGFHISIALLLHFPILPNVLGEKSTITPAAVLTDINTRREEQNLPSLNNNPLLTQAAERKAQDMLQQSYWAHTSPNGQEPWDFIEDAGYAYSVAGENLARNFNSSQMMVSAWMASPTHRDNILHSQYQDTGIAVAEGSINGKNVTVVVQLFGSPEGAVAAADLPDQAYATTRFIMNTAGQNAENILGAQFSVTPVTFYRGGVITMLLILVGILAHDMMQVQGKKLRRHVGKNLAHIILLIAVITTVFLAETGSLL